MQTPAIVFISLTATDDFVFIATYGVIMEITYQKATKNDIEALYAFNKELIDSYEDLKSIEYDKVLNWIRHKLETYISDYTCILSDGEKAGYFCFKAADGAMELDDLYVFPKHRNKGIGSTVIRKCLSETPLPITLYVFRKNIGALRLYKKMGFEISENVGETRYIMRTEPAE